MKFLELPGELIREILVQAVISRGLKRGLRLRSVCKLFAAEVTQAVYASHILDGYCLGHEPPFHMPYLQYRMVRLSKENAPPRARVVLETAELLCARTDYARDDFDRERKCIEILCELIRPGCYYDHVNYEIPIESDYNQLDKHLLVAAAYLNQQELVRELARDAFKKQRYRFDMQSLIFGSPIDAAAQNGHAEVLEILFENMPEDTTIETKRRKKYSAAYDAAFHGHLEAFSLFLNDRWVGWENPHVSLPGKGASHPLYIIPFTPNKEIHRRWKAFLAKRPFSLFKSRPMVDIVDVLQAHVKNGNTEMFEYLIKNNFSGPFMPHRIDMPNKSGSKLVEQICYWSKPIFRVIERNVADWPQNLATVCYAANGGQFEIVKTLVENGQFIDAMSSGAESKCAVVAAFVNEDVKMFEYLLDHGAKFDTVDTLGMAVQMAKTEGLDSMLEILKKRGISVEQYPDWPKRKKLRCQHCRSMDEYLKSV